jgi:hypothetical protein
MRIEPGSPRGITPRATAFVVACLALSLAACGGGAAATPPPTPAPAATPTPDRHLTGNLDPNRIFQVLAASNSAIRQESISSGPSGEPVVLLFLRDGVQPLTIAQFSSAKARTDAGYVGGSKVVAGDSPYTFWAANIVIYLGPRDEHAMPAAPGADLEKLAADLVAAIDPYIGPLDQRSVRPITLPSTPAPTATSSPSASPKGTPKPSPKATPKPTKKPKATPKP